MRIVIHISQSKNNDIIASRIVYTRGQPYNFQSQRNKQKTIRSTQEESVMIEKQSKTTKGRVWRVNKNKGSDQHPSFFPGAFYFSFLATLFMSLFSCCVQEGLYIYKTTGEQCNASWHKQTTLAKKRKKKKCDLKNWAFLLFGCWIDAVGGVGAFVFVDWSCRVRCMCFRCILLLRFSFAFYPFSLFLFLSPPFGPSTTSVEQTTAFCEEKQWFI